MRQGQLGFCGENFTNTTDIFLLIVCALVDWWDGWLAGWLVGWLVWLFGFWFLTTRPID
jgi:hypothetical protein